MRNRRGASQGVRAVQNAINALAPLASFVASLTASSLTGSASYIDFYAPGAVVLGGTTLNIDNFWGQATLPFATAPTPHLSRGTGIGRPGVVTRSTQIPQGNAWDPSLSFTFDSGDPDSYYATDGRLDTAWITPVSGGNDLLVSISLPPTLGVNANLNLLGLLPWPAFGSDIIGAWIRQGGVWAALDLRGQLGYNTTNGHVEKAGPCRFAFYAHARKRNLL